MKNIFGILISCVVVACISCRTKAEQSTQLNSYSIYKLDSINNFYLIYAKKNDELYKIVSQKTKDGHGCKTPVKVGMNYEFNLRAMSENAPTIGGVKIAPMNSLDVNCYQFDKETSICKEAGMMNDLFTAENLIGKCIVNPEKKTNNISGNKG